MKDLDRLHEIAEASLGGLTAGPQLKQRVLQAAKGEKRPAAPVYRRAWVPALSCALVLAITLAVTLPRPDAQTPVITSQTAGDGTVVLEKADLGNGSVTVEGRSAVPAYRSIWAKGSGSAFPLLRVEGRWYRLLTEPASVSTSALGSKLGQVEEYTAEPTLSTSGCILSNTVAVGSDVWAVKGMNGTLLAAEVQGSLRAFQRVSLNGSALIGSEGLKDTLALSGHIRTMALSDVGTVSDSARAEQLFAALLRGAAFESGGSLNGSQSLIITLDNGLSVQLAVKGDRLAACGIWTCPDFFEAFRQAI